MTRYVLRRLLQAIPLILLISAAVFGLIQLVPGGPMGVYGKNPNLSAEDLARLEEKLGLNQPVHVQYLNWLGQVAQGNFGYSYDTKRPVTAEIGDRLPATLYLMGVTFVVVLAIAIPVGILCAVKQYSWLDIVISTLAFAGQALPVFWVGLMLIMIFYGWARNPFTGEPLLPARGMATLGEDFKRRRSPPAPDPAGHDSRVGLGFLVLPLPPLQHARRAASGVRADGARQGTC